MPNGKRKKVRFKHLQGHPAKVQAMRQKLGVEGRQWDYEVRELARDVRKEASANPQEGHLVGPLYVAAKHAAPAICEQLGLGDEDRRAVVNYLTVRLGDVIDGFSIADYREWRDDCRQRAGTGSSGRVTGSPVSTALTSSPSLISKPPAP